MHYYTVHYPNGITRKHGNAREGKYLPDLEKVFYLGGKSEIDGCHFQIAEMSEEEIWVEAISKTQYYETIHSTNESTDNFAYFYMDPYPSVKDFLNGGVPK